MPWVHAASTGSFEEKSIIIVRVGKLRAAVFKIDDEY